MELSFVDAMDPPFMQSEAIIYAVVMLFGLVCV